jgi:hypothetical protein
VCFASFHLPTNFFEGSHPSVCAGEYGFGWTTNGHFLEHNLHAVAPQPFIAPSLAESNDEFPQSLTFQQVQKYEKGTNRIGAGRLQQIADAGAGAPAAGVSWRSLCVECIDLKFTRP